MYYIIAAVFSYNRNSQRLDIDKSSQPDLPSDSVTGTRKAFRVYDELLSYPIDADLPEDIESSEEDEVLGPQVIEVVVVEARPDMLGVM